MCIKIRERSRKESRRCGGDGRAFAGDGFFEAAEEKMRGRYGQRIGQVHTKDLQQQQSIPRLRSTQPKDLSHQSQHKVHTCICGIVVYAITGCPHPLCLIGIAPCAKRERQRHRRLHKPLRNTPPAQIQQRMQPA